MTAANDGSERATRVIPPPSPAMRLSRKRHTAIYWAVAGVLATVMLVTGLITLILNAADMGPGAFVVAVICAVLPVPVYLGLFLWLDRFEPEPPLLLALAFFWGATASICVAGCLNTLFGLMVKAIIGNAGIAQQAMASIAAPLNEETWKGLAVLAIFLLRREDFDGILDGIIYAGVTALGFAMAENVEYYGGALHNGGIAALGVTAVLRGIMSPYTHVLFTSMTGIGFGLAATAKNTTLKFVYPIGGWMAAMFLHSCWNTIPSLFGEDKSLLVLLISYFIVWVPMFAMLVGLVFWSLRRESKLVTMQLAHYVSAGELTSEEAAKLGRLWPRLTGMGVGPQANSPWGIRRKYTRCATMLAFYRYRVAIGHMKENAELEAGELAELRALRGGREPASTLLRRGAAETRDDGFTCRRWGRT